MAAPRVNTASKKDKYVERFTNMLLLTLRADVSDQRVNGKRKAGNSKDDSNFSITDKDTQRCCCSLDGQSAPLQIDTLRRLGQADQGLSVSS